MALSRSQLFELILPFFPGEHGFTPVGGGQVPYLKKSAIERRLFRVVPGWSLTDVEHLASENDVVALTGTLVLEGQRFTAVGTGIVQRFKKNDKTGAYDPLPAYEVARNSAKAYKQADSDLLPRCAKLAGIGWYLREIPPEWKGKIGTPPGLAEYLTFVRESVKGWNPDGSTEPKLGAGDANERRIK